MRSTVVRCAALAAAAVVLGSACAGCSGPRAAGRATAGPVSAGPASARPQPAGYAPVLRRFCAEPPDRHLRADLDTVVSGSLRREIIPLGLAPGGHSAFVFTRGHRFAGVATLDLATGHVTTVQRFASGRRDQADGASAGRWLVWEETYSLQSLDRFTVRAWDSVTSRLVTLGHSLAAPDGRPWPSPWHAPAVSGGYAAWAQGYGPGGEVEIMLADLATGQVKVIRTGHLQPPFFDGGLVVWPESDRPGTQTTLHAYDLATGQTAALPPALAAVHGTEFVVTGNGRTAYFSPGLNGLYYSPAPSSRARLVLRLPEGTSFSGLTMGTGWLAWTTTSATYLADLATGAYARVTPEYGFATGSGSEVLISDPASKASLPVLPLHLIRPASVTWAACTE